jgi:enoyl-CoA hydratase/carnithine racemase
MTDLLVEQDGPVLRVTFNRPHAHNALTFAMYEGVHDACEKADADPGIRVLVLRGAGGKAFVSGTDIAQFAGFDGAAGVEYEERMTRVLRRLEDTAVPTVAAVDGYCVGGGLALASACDLRIATAASRFGVPIARTLGNCLSMAGYARLVAVLGEARVKDVVFTARMVGADEALAAGLVSAVVPDDEIEAHVTELAERVAGHAPITLRVTKEALRRLRAEDLPEGADLVEEAYGSEDFRAGVAAFLDKRRHAWTGR